VVRSIYFKAIKGPYLGHNNDQMRGPYSIDFHPGENKLIITTNMPQELFKPQEEVRLKVLMTDDDSLPSPFAATANLGRGEIKIAVVRNGGGGFRTGEIFTSRNANGDHDQGVILRISSDGSTVQNPWVVLPSPNSVPPEGRPEGVIYGLHHDTTGVFGNDLIAISIRGDVWRIRSTGWSGSNHCPLAMLNRYIEGVVTVPNVPERYGPLASKILVGAPQSDLNRQYGVGHLNDPAQTGIYAISPNGYTEFFSSRTLDIYRGPDSTFQSPVAANVHNITIVPQDENFFALQYASPPPVPNPDPNAVPDRTALWAADSSDFHDIVGGILIQDWFPKVAWTPSTGLWHIHWTGQGFKSMQIPITYSDHANQPFGDYVHHWTGMTFAPLKF
jgi:hypothetical protein